ncbi:unnamed protein product [Caenorhabditis sp. 36 PRJEB53466]|nr:unnamed protein product [Caenorhabditis sp. 36 PRJEB53466]
MKKVAKLNTCAYVYEKLFVQGEESDITIVACGKEWKVHKLYLKQAKFFESMFDREWAESKSGRVKLKITDSNINAEGLNAVLGSLYHNEIEIDLEKIEGTVAAASYLMLESVTDRCAEMMIDALSTDNAIRYYELSTNYGLDSVREQSMQLLLHNFWKIMTDKNKLREIDHQMLTKLLTSPDVLITEGEFDLYKIVKLWIFMRECPDCDTDEQHEIIDEMTSSLWSALLENEESPKALEVDDDEFFNKCIRLGRTLDTYPKCWRWIGFNFGVDLLLHVNEYTLCIKRNCLNQKAPYSVNLRSKHVLHYRIVICDSTGTIIFDSGKTTWEMRPDEVKTIYRLPEDSTIPLSVHFQYLIHSPVSSSQFVQKFLEEQVKSE